MFSDLFDIQKSQLELVFVKEAIWSKKSEYLKKLNDKIKERLSQAFRLWNLSSKALSHFKTLNN